MSFNDEVAVAEFTRAITAELESEALELPSFPEIAMQVRKALANEGIGVDEVVRMVSAEPSLAVRLLQLANSVALNPGVQRVTTLRAAITRIGFNLARSATIAFAMSQMRRAQGWRDLATRFREIWDASAQLAATSYALARNHSRLDADQALLAGMLHGIGKLFVLIRLSRFPTLLGDERMAARLEATWHRRAGRALLTRWDLPPDVVEAACDFAESVPKAARASLRDVLAAADRLIAGHQGGEVPEELFATPPFVRLGLDAARAGSLMAESAAEIAAIKAALADQA